MGGSGSEVNLKMVSTGNGFFFLMKIFANKLTRSPILIWAFQDFNFSMYTSVIYRKRYCKFRTPKKVFSINKNENITANRFLGIFVMIN